MSSRANRWRAPVTGAVAGLVVAAAIAGSSALASGGRAASAPATTKAALASAAPCAISGAKDRATGSQAASAGPAPTQFLAAVAQLVQAGTIKAAQARVLDADIQAGSIDPRQLVANGTLSSAQMQAVSNRLIAVKRSLASASQGGGAGSGKARRG